MRRREVLAGASALLLSTPFIARAQAAARVVVVGGGFGGATAAQFLRRADRRLDVALVEANPEFTACPFSNEVIAGLRDIAAQRFSYGAIAADGVRVIPAKVTAVDPATRRVTLGSGAELPYTTSSWRPESISPGARCPATTKLPPSKCRMHGRPASRPCSCKDNSRRCRMAGWWSCRRPEIPIAVRLVRTSEQA